MSEAEKKIKQKPGKIISNNLYMLGRIFHYAPVYIILTAIEGIIWGIINAVYVIFNARLFNSLDKGTPLIDLMFMILLMGLFYIAVFMFSNWYWFYAYMRLRRRFQVKIHTELFEKARNMDLACFDDPEFYNDFVWAMNESDDRAAKVLNDTGKLINRLVATASVLGVLVTIDWRVAIALFVVSAVNVVIYQYGNKLGFKQNKEANPVNRKIDYINRVYHLADYAKEIRISRVNENLCREHNSAAEQKMEINCRYGKKYFIIYGIFSNLIRLLGDYGIPLYMFLQLNAGNILLGGYAASVYSIWRVRWFLADFVERIAKFPEHSLYIEKYRQFMNWEPEIKSGELPVCSFESLAIKSAGFEYTPCMPEKEGGKEKKPVRALTDVSLEIRRGEKIALVGYNGAGKTTLIKLLLRLYDVTEGEILYNGINIKNYNTEQYRSHIGVVFQDYKLFAATIAENVLGGDYTDTEEQRETVLSALRASSFEDKLAQLPDGINTPLTREFDEKGVNLSGGESQKVAIARVFAKPYELIIMDEPSSALDPISEYKLNHSILEGAKDRTVIFISHRLSTTRMADRIYMFENGSIIESGSHEELMALDGKYSEMFRVQAEKYQTA